MRYRFAKYFSTFILAIIVVGMAAYGNFSGPLQVQQVQAATITAASCSSANVQTAINSAANGDTVVIPAGTCAWSSTVNITGKYITLSGGTLGNVTITGGADVDQIYIDESTAGHTEIKNIIFSGGTHGASHFIFINGSTNSKSVLIHDNKFMGQRDAIRAGTIRGVIWNNTFDAGAYTGSIITTEALQMKPEQSAFSYSWTTPSTMGTNDLTGDSNLYFENNTIIQHHTETLDADGNSRIVIRYNNFIDSGFTSHGPDTGPIGTRHWEVYNNTFTLHNFGDCSGAQTAPVDYWFFIRGGTGVIANNNMPDLNTCAWGNKAEISMTVMQLRRNAGPEACWTGGYPAPRQIGQSYGTNGTITEPVYIWGNSGLPSGNPFFDDYSPNECGGSAPLTSTFVQLGRDYILSAKPNYTPYPYPHPLAAALIGPADTTAPSVPTGLSATAASSSQINLSWTASSDNVGVAGYKVFRNGTQVGTPSTNSYSDTGLTASTTYSYTVSANDAAGNNSSQSSSANATTQAAASDTTPPTVSISSPTGGATVSGTTAITSNASDNVGVAGVQFKIDGTNLGSEDTTAPYSASWDTTTATSGSHTITAVARDTSNNTTTSAGVSVTVGSGGGGGSGGHNYTTNFPNTENPISEGGNWINGATTGLDWANVQSTPGKGFGTNLPTTFSDPTAVLTGAWGPNQTAQGTISITNSSSCCREVELRLRTNITAHSITGYEINCSVAGNANQYLQIVRWNGPVSNFTYLNEATTNCVNGDVLKASMTGGTITVWKNGTQVLTTNDNTFTNGSPGIGYYNTSGGAWSGIAFSNFTATDGTGSDTTAPSTPTGLSATATSSSQINLTWTASTDNVGVSGYKVFRNGTQVGTPSTNSYSDTGLTASTNYSYTVSANDAAGNNSSQSSSANATTQAGVSDATAPSVPTNLSATTASAAQINLTWTASTDNVGVTGYKVFRNGTQVGTPITNSYSDTGLTASTTYSYTVSANDAAGNNSAQSSSTNATTQASGAGFAIGDRVIALQAVAARSTATTSGTILGTHNAGDLGTITAGPTSGEGWTWWNINYDTGADGWSTQEGYLAKSSATFDFILSNGGNTTVVQGSSATNSVTASITGGSATTVSYSASGLPAGASASFSPTSCSPTCTTTMTITTTGSTPIASSTITVTATGGSITHTTTFSLAVNAVTGQPPALPSGNTGIAASYLNDTGISANPNVLFADNFETYTTPSQFTSSGNYSNYYAAGNFAIDTTTFFGGAKSVRMRMPQSGSEVSGGLVHDISPTRDSMYMRVYTRFQPGYAGLNSSHNGLRITGKYKGPGIRPDGQGVSNGFLVNIENNTQIGEGEPGNTHAYVYQPENTDVYGENWYPDGQVTNGSFNFGQYFTARPKVIPARGQWISYEVLVQLNTPGLRDGRIAVWQDGLIIADWQNVRFRDVSTLKIDQIELDNGGQGSTQVNDKWYDNLVLASSYIGPVSTSAPTFDFTMSNGGNKSVVQGSSVTNTATGTLTVGPAQAVTFTASGLPTGASASFSPTSCNLTCTTTMTVTTTGSTPAGTSTITVTGTAGSTVRTTTFTLTVTGAANVLPVGSFDGIKVDGVTIYGWSYDPDSTTSSNNIQIFVNGAVGTGTLINSQTTSFLRTDVNSNFGITGNHGWEFVIPAQYRDGFSHSYYIYGIDFNDSTKSFLLTGSPKSFTIASASDTTAPSTPTGLTATAVSSTGINLAWTASTDNIGVTGYKVFRAGTQIGTSATNSYSDTGLTASTNYSYTVSANDAAGNNSAQSSAASATTSAASGGAFAIGDRVIALQAVAARSSASTAATILQTHATGELGTVTAGPTSANGWTWWNINYDTGTDGWSTQEGYLAKATSDTTAPSVPTNLTATATSSSQINLSWTASTDNVGVTGYNIFRNGSQINTSVSTSYSDTGLVASTAYTYTVSAHDAGGNSSAQSTSAIATTQAVAFDFTMSNGGPKTVAQGSGVGNTITATLASGNAAAVTFTASGLPTGSSASFSPTSCSPTCSTTVTITTNSATPIAASTITVTGTAGSVVHTTTFTLTVTDGVAPTVSLTAPAANVTVSGSTTTVSATASDNVGVVGVQFKLDGVNLNAEDTTSPYSIVWNTNTASNTTHNITAVARDAAGQTTTSSAITVTVNNIITPPTDTTAPSVPTNLAATATSSTQINLTWTASTDNTAVTGYKVFRNGTQVATNITLTSYSDTGLTGSTNYSYTVSAFDAANNNSAQSSSSSATTQAPADTIAPVVIITTPINNATVSATTSISAIASDNVAVVGVQFKRDGINLGAEDTSAPYSFNWDTTGTTNAPHTLTAVARDAAGNSTTSGAITITVDNVVVVPTDTVPPTSPVGLSAASISSSQINLTWNAATDNIGVVGYRIFRSGTQIATAITLTSYQDVGLSASTNYSYSVLAYDAANNTSAQSTSASATTQAAPPSGGGGSGGTTNPSPTPPQTPSPSPTVPVRPDMYPPGCIFKYANNPTVYILGANSVANPITSWSVYLNQVPATRSIITIPDSVTFTIGPVLGLRGGTLIKASNDPTVYLVVNGKREAFSTEQQFHDHNYNFSNVYSIDDINLVNSMAITTDPFVRPTGTLFKYANSPAVYFLNGAGLKRGYTSIQMFNIWNATLKDVITIPATETYPDGPIATLPDGIAVKGSGATIYFTYNGTLRAFNDVNLLTSMGLTLAQVKTFPDSDIALHSIGSPMQ